MATTSNPLEEFLQSDVDENALNALVGSLESQLSTPTVKDSPHQISGSNSVNKLVNRANIGGSASPAGILDGPKSSGNLNTGIVGATNSNINIHNNRSVSGNNNISPITVQNVKHPSLNSISISRANSASPVQRHQVNNIHSVGQQMINNGHFVSVNHHQSASPINSGNNRTIKQEPRSAPSPRNTVPNIVPRSQPIIVRTPITGQQQLIMSSSAPRLAGGNQQLKTLAPRIVGNPIRIGVNQQQAIAPRPGTSTHNMMMHGRGPPFHHQPHDMGRGKPRSTITIPAGMALPQNAVFIKNEQGQIVMVTPQNAGSGGMQPPTSSTSSAGKIVIRPQSSMQNVAVGRAAPHVSHVSHVSQPATITTATSPQMAPAQLDNIKKCKNFLTTLIKLAASQPKDTVDNVRSLIQGLIDGQVDPEAFTQKLQIVLRSSPQPYLVPFLKKSLPQLRQCLASGKMTIEGVRPPKSELLVQTATPTTPKMAPRPAMVHRVVKGSPMMSASQAAMAHKDKRKFETLKEDDDINDVATMGGVNLSEESRHLASNSEILSSQMRSCKDEYFLNTAPLLKRINAIARKHDIHDVPPEIAHVISHAAQERLRTLIEKLSTISEHRQEMYKVDQRLEVCSDTKDRLKFLDELDKLEKKRHEDIEREVLLRAAKSRSKVEDPEQARLKQKAREMQQEEMEKVRQREANLTALAAIGPRKKRRLDGSLADSPSSSAETGSMAPPSASSSTPRAGARPRMKRVMLRDLVFLLEQDRETSKSNLVYKSFLK